MIKRVKYKDIDFIKYTNCLENSQQRKYSATKEFLDITTQKNWEILIYNDYEAVMPIPYIKKMGFKIVHNPMLCQQLGVFSSNDSIIINDSFFSFLEENYLVRVYNFNDENSLSTDLKKRKNFIIYPESYDIVYSKYSPKRKRKLRLDPEVKARTNTKIISFEEAKPFMKENLLGANKERDVDLFLDRFEMMNRQGLIVCTAFYYTGKLINLIATYEDQKTIALLGTFNDKEYVKLSGASILIDQTIRNTIASKIFDFEGSELPNVEEFFRGFRPELKPYIAYDVPIKALIKKVLNIKFIMKYIAKL